MFSLNNKTIPIVSFLIGILTFTSCIEYKIISIQTLKPSELAISSDFSHPIIVASIYKGIEGVEESMAQAAIDSTAAVEAAFVLSENLFDTPWYQGLEIPTRIFFRDDASQFILPFPWKTVEGLAAEDNADLVISLEYIKIKPTTQSYSYWDGYMNKYYGSLTMGIYGFWRVYDLKKRKVVADYLYKDTLIWDQSDYTRVRIGEQLPGFFSAAKYCGYITGSEFAKQIAPSWMDEQRLYYTKGSKHMRKAVEFVQYNQWLDAASQWQKVIQDPKTKPEIAAKAAFNMALANEMKGNFDIAMEWLIKSQEFTNIPEVTWYKRILELRIQVMEKL
jgi:hypothetical protein